MPVNNTVKLVFSDSDEEKDNDSLVSDVESDVEDDENFDERQDLASSTQIEPKPKPKPKSNVKLELAGILRNIGVATKNSRAIKTIPWNKVNIDGYDQDDLKKELDEIIKVVGTIRTLDEILADYEKNFQRYDFTMHPDHPIKPISHMLTYVKENRAKYEKQLEKQNPGVKCSYTDVVKLAAAKFNALPDIKKNVYLDRYKNELKEYKLKLQEFYQEHPDLKIKKRSKAKLAKKVKEVKLPKVKAPKVSKSKIMTPFVWFREQQLKDGNFLGLKVLQQMWKDLPNEEKGQYVADVVGLLTDKEKKLSKEELKIFETHNGLPDRPPVSCYNLFVSQARKTYTGNPKDFLKTVSVLWKEVGPKEKKKLQEELDEAIAKWKKKMQVYIRNLPAEQQTIMTAKYHVFQTPSKNKKLEVSLNKTKNGKKETSESESEPQPSKNFNKRKIEDTSDEEEFQFELENSPKKRVKSESDEVSSPSKKKKKKEIESIQELSPVKPTSPKKKKIQEPEYPSQTEEEDHFELENSPKKRVKSESDEVSTISKKKKKKNEVESSQELPTVKPTSPKKKKIQEPEYPSQTTAHYFMTKIYQGKPSKVAKAYKKLDQKQKAQYRNEMNIQRRAFLPAVAKYMNETGSKEVAEQLQKKLKDFREQQTKDIAWHEDEGTDAEKPKRAISTDSDSDSDSS